MFNKAGLAGIMKQAQQMQENMKKAQLELAEMDVEGDSGAGMVKVVMSCTHTVRRVDIDRSLLVNSADDQEILEDLVAAALNDANRKAMETTKKHMSGFASGLDLPDGMNLPF